jgi:hypothetical protein
MNVSSVFCCRAHLKCNLPDAKVLPVPVECFDQTMACTCQSVSSNKLKAIHSKDKEDSASMIATDPSNFVTNEISD